MIIGKASKRVWMGTAIVAALAVGVLLGGSFASRSEALVQAPAQNFTGDAGLVLHVVNPANATDFENAMRAFKDTLAASSDAQRQQMAAGFRLFRAAEVGPNNFTLYYQLVDPNVSGGNYSLVTVLAEEYGGGPPGNGDEVRALYGGYTEALQGGGQQIMNLSLVAGF
ncbi:MAG: hypothetical protein CL484_16050 [Acidobacteria bacterium]|nr:hypothetical protein [Acidobacteriota bacterium]